MACRVRPSENFLIFLQEIDHPGSLVRVETRPDLQDVQFLFCAYVDFFCRLDRSELVILEALQTLFNLGHLTVLVKPFPEVYGLGLFEKSLGWDPSSAVWPITLPNTRETSKYIDSLTHRQLLPSGARLRFSCQAAHSPVLSGYGLLEESPQRRRIRLAQQQTRRLNPSKGLQGCAHPNFISPEHACAQLCNAAWECPPSWGRATDALEKEPPLIVYDP
ncbi:hypothetical protein CRG98_015686 [Punica granatum]|uniref:Uncharacterized protein n=1 Tax=Punica granatum TaxID=22663 RepID=A0A2I0K5U0_PUNGR|nr:hypothetical protein CRG98_015686 [Punica granatum]